ncbi:hypothetical protein LPU83_pLPU83d_1625 (plasmid) [Rhizobium favelukesii]|uniref:Uncharacterized protein n=1 Tax=Rhizobium favelukesii TaxID=348824 RepID=W6RS80_9HYPH|nr:hypothetical protein LPU83_pLPU83d_1625 [Rhizobium favelukesii]
MSLSDGNEGAKAPFRQCVYVSRLHELLPWTWKRLREAEKNQDQYIA